MTECWQCVCVRVRDPDLPTRPLYIPDLPTRPLYDPDLLTHTHTHTHTHTRARAHARTHARTQKVRLRRPGPRAGSRSGRWYRIETPEGAGSAPYKAASRDRRRPKYGSGQCRRDTPGGARGGRPRLTRHAGREAAPYKACKPRPLPK